jgi:hypothetical protein
MCTKSLSECRGNSRVPSMRSVLPCWPAFARGAPILHFMGSFRSATHTPVSKWARLISGFREGASPLCWIDRLSILSVALLFLFTLFSLVRFSFFPWFFTRLVCRSFLSPGSSLQSKSSQRNIVMDLHVTYIWNGPN